MLNGWISDPQCVEGSVGNSYQFWVDVSFFDARFEEREIDGDQFVGHFSISLFAFVKYELKTILIIFISGDRSRAV